MSKKESYVEQKSSELKQWKIELEELKERARETTGGLKAKLDNQMKELQRLREEGGSRLKRVVDAGEDAWEGFREDVEHTWKAFRHSVNYFNSHFKDRDSSGKR